MSEQVRSRKQQAANTVMHETFLQEVPGAKGRPPSKKQSSAWDSLHTPVGKQQALLLPTFFGCGRLVSSRGCLAGSGGQEVRRDRRD